MKTKINKQLSVLIALLSVIWVILFAIQIDLAKRVYSHQKDLFAVKLSEVFQDVLSSVDTVDYPVFDSLISANLQKRDIFYPYDLGIYSDETGECLYLTENAKEKDLLENGIRFKILLVTNDGTHAENILLHFPSLVRKFRREMVFGYLVILLLFILLLGCFVNFFYIILKQRKLDLFKEKMAHFVTHELKTPLTTISLSAQLLRDDSVVTDEDAKNTYLDLISEETKVLESLVNQVLSVFRTKNMPLIEMKDVEIHKVLKEVCKVHKPRIDECGAEVEYDFKAECDVVTGNETNLFNAFSNLVDNAIKYRKDPLRLVISTRNVAEGIEIKVSDNGIGISKENLSLIFEPFTRLNTEDAYYVKGFGVGLNFVKHIVEYHKGEVKVESELNKGTAFTVILPLANK